MWLLCSRDYELILPELQFSLAVYSSFKTQLKCNFNLLIVIRLYSLHGIHKAAHPCSSAKAEAGVLFDGKMVVCETSCCVHSES